MRRIDRQRRQDRKDLPQEHGIKVLLVGELEIDTVDDLDPLTLHFAAQRGPGLLLRRHQPAGILADLHQLLCRGQPVMRGRGMALLFKFPQGLRPER